MNFPLFYLILSLLSYKLLFHSNQDIGVFTCILCVLCAWSITIFIISLYGEPDIANYADSDDPFMQSVNNTNQFFVFMTEQVCALPFFSSRFRLACSSLFNKNDD